MVYPVDIPKNAKIVYGHFCFDDLPLPRHRKIKRGAFFRDPVEWVGSYYYYNRQKHPSRISGDILNAVRDIGLSSGFRRFLGSVEVEDLDFVGLQENYEGGLLLFEKIFGVSVRYRFKNPSPVPISNNGTYRGHFLKEGILGDIETAMSENMAIYSRAVERHNFLMRANGLWKA
jgi:hypothetical protein